MAQDFGSGVSRTLSALERQFVAVVWQKQKPPLDAEFNLVSQIRMEELQKYVQSMMHSGFIMDPTASDRDFETDPSWSNFFRFGSVSTGEDAPILWANVNGWVIPVTGSAVSEGDPSNRVDLWPPPASDTRIDLVFLEVWLAQVAPNPSTLNKPAADTVWKWGNVLYGGTNIADDIEDPTIGFETAERVQVQYRIRVFGSGSGLGNSVALDDYPDGLDDPNVLGQGGSTSPVAGFTFSNMREELGDPGLWRAGDGDANNDLGTVDGYSYAVPICAVFRRNSDVFVARTASGNANQNGAFDRNPSTVAYSEPADGTEVFLTATLTNTIDETTTGDVQVTNLVGSGLDNADINWSNSFLVMGGEVFSIGSVNTSVSPATMRIRATGGRGRWGTMAVPHAAGTAISFFNWRHDGLYADQIAETDILELRRAVNPGDWDYMRLLMHNFAKLLQGNLRSSYKQAGIGDTQGPYVVEVDTLLESGTIPNQTEGLDGPDGIRTVFSDASTVQGDVTMLFNDPATLSGGSPGLISQFDSGVNWEVGAPLLPGGWLNNGNGWANGDIFFIHIGGVGGGDGARLTFRDGTTRAVRFIGPREYWKSTASLDEVGAQYPFSLRFLGERSMEPAAPSEIATAHPGPEYPLWNIAFEKPYIVLGGILNNSLQVSGVTVYPESAPGAADWEVRLPGLDFDLAGGWYSKTGSFFNNDPDLVSDPLLHSTRTLFGMLTDNGRDRTGAASEVYLVLWGDTVNAVNNGVFRVVGAGSSAGYTTRNATASDRVRVEPMCQGVADFVSATGLEAEARSQYMHADDGGGYSSGRASIAIVLTDIYGVFGATLNPWNASNLGTLRLPQSGSPGDPIPGKLEVRTTLQYHPGRGATARVADQLHRLAVVDADSAFLRQAPAARDTTFPSAAGVPDDETYFDIQSIQTWNRLSSWGLTAPNAPAYGGEVISFTEQDREGEAFMDAGSKTLLFRPFLDRAMTLVQHNVTGQLIPTSYGTITTDGAGIFLTGLSYGYPLPPEFMPRFGRQDIPFYVDITGTGAGTFLQGINHLFTDSTTQTEAQFNIIGGADNGGTGGIESMLIQTGSSSGLDYGEYGTVFSARVGYQGRLYADPRVVSSDIGRVLRGIQLPPFLGLARVYGVYDRRDFVTAGGNTFETDRITPKATAPPNLLRTDADKQTLFIIQGGASDVTGNDNDHTYVLPEQAIDITLSDSYVSGETFSDLEYVVECCVFGFARGWINENNYVMARLHNGDGNPGISELDGLRMTLPAPAPSPTQVYAAYNRTPYQGDPYMTRDGSTRVVSDYEHRYGQIDSVDAYELSTPIQQFDSNGNILVETPNTRALQILAAMDFYTTLGTGKIGGSVYPGTITDVGHVQNSPLAAGRVPADPTDPLWQVAPRAFTEGQQAINTAHANLRFSVINNGAIAAGDGLLITRVDGTTIAIRNGIEYAVGGTAIATAANIVAAINTYAGDAVYAEQNPPSNIVMVISAVVSGPEGEGISVAISNTTAFRIDINEPALATGVTTKAYLQGGIDIPMNAGDGDSAIKLTGLTERLPLGILIQDSDFIGEDPLRDGSSQLKSGLGVFAGTQTVTPLFEGQEYTRLTGGPGQWLAMADGGILRYTPYTDSTPTGSKKFRLFRGGGSGYVITPPTPGGPVDWAAGTLPEGFEPVVKGGVLVGKALLVRNFHEEAFTGSETVSHGDEIQMVVLTRGYLGRGTERTTGVSLTGILSPTGYGEGYAASDRYRLEGKPILADHTREAPPTDVDLALYLFDDLTPNTE